MAIAIHHVRLIDGTGQAIEPATVIVRNSKIAAAGPSRTISIPRGAARINGRGLTVLPGLIDCHVHLCLGAEPDVVKTIEAFVKEYGITHILMGRSQRPWYRRWFGQSVLDRLLRTIPGVDVLVVDSG